MINMLRRRSMSRKNTKRVLALILALCIMTSILPVASVLAGNEDLAQATVVPITTPEVKKTAPGLIMDTDTGEGNSSEKTVPEFKEATDQIAYLEDPGSDEDTKGEVLAIADSLEHARRIADAYKLELKSYAYGIAVLNAPDAELAVTRSSNMRTVGIPKLSLNRTYHIAGGTGDIGDTGDTGDTDVTGDIGVTGDTDVTDDTGVTDNTGVTGGTEDNTDDQPGSDESTGSTLTNQWHHAEMDTERAWEVTKGEHTVVAIIDTGIDIDHPAFDGRISERSFNAYTKKIGITHVRDDYGHGTHVSGVAAASLDSAEGKSGVAPNAELLVIKANMPNRDEFRSVELYRAINYAVENGADVINMSFGRYYYDWWDFDETEHMILANAVSKGVTVVCSAGNNGDDHVFFPAAYDECVAVSATKQGYRFDYSSSNYGPEIDIAAPGCEINSTAIGGGYDIMSGTSMSSANVTGVVALIKSLNPEFSSQQVKDVLYRAARDTGEIGRDDYYGHGIVNAYAAVLRSDKFCNVTYDFMDGSHTPIIITAALGSKLLKPSFPQREGYAFDGWYISGTDDEFVFTETVEGNLKLDAKWVEAQPGMYIQLFPDKYFRFEVLRVLNEQDSGNRKDSSLVENDLSILASIDTIDVSGMNVWDMTGLGYLTGLTNLFCNGNHLTELDVSKSTMLAFLHCTNNLLTELDVSNNTALIEFRCFNNPLDRLDISHNPELQRLYCYNIQLTELDVTKNPALEVLECGYNQLTELDVTKNPALEQLRCEHNKLTELDVTKNPALVVLECNNNQLTELDVTKKPALVALFCDANQLTGLDVMKNTMLTRLTCSQNGLKEIVISENPGLEIFMCSENQLTTLNVTKNPALEVLECGHNQLTELDVTNNTTLKYLTCDYNKLEKIDVSKNLMLQELWCGVNHLTELNVSGNADLYALDCSYNNLTKLDVSNNPDLIWLYVNNNQLTNLNIEKNLLLWGLSAEFNNMSSLDDVVGWRQIGLVLYEAPDWEGNLYFYPQRMPSPTGLTNDGKGIVSWDAVPGAQWYSIHIEGHSGYWWIDENEFDLREILGALDVSAINNGQIQIRISAADGEAPEFAKFESDLSQPLSINIPVLPGTLNISIENDGYTLSWNAIENADMYIIYINGEKRNDVYSYEDTLCSDLRTYKLYPDVYEVQIVAVAIGDNIGVSKLSNTVLYTQPLLPPLQPVPVVTIRNSILTWNDVEGADWYVISVFLNGVGYYWDNTWTTQFDMRFFDNLSVGKTYQIKVIAIGDWINNMNSEPSEPVLYIPDGSLPPQLKRPANLKLKDKTLMWDSIDHAIGYDIYVDGKAYAWTIDPEYDLSNSLFLLPEGTYKVKIVADGIRGVYRDSEFSEEFNLVVTSGSSSNGNGNSTGGAVNNLKETAINTTDSAILDEKPVRNPFTDVTESAWYKEAVLYVYEKGLMNGTGTNPMKFSPNITLSRAMIVTILYRQEGEPDVSDLTNPFSDVPPGTWYTDAVVWAAENGIVNGYPNGSFAPNDNIKRQDLALILMRYADIKEIELPVTRTYQSFNDETMMADYAKDSVTRCFEAGIINGKTGNIFDPSGNATRAETATMLQRFLESLKK